MSEGIAKASPAKKPLEEIMLLFNPTNSPDSLPNAPPEFPGFIATSV